jgi:hypothetical protein
MNGTDLIALAKEILCFCYAVGTNFEKLYRRRATFKGLMDEHRSKCAHGTINA